MLPWDLSDKLSFWGDRRDYWNYLSEGIGRMKALETIVKQVQTLAHVSHVIPSMSHVIVMWLSAVDHEPGPGKGTHSRVSRGARTGRPHTDSRDQHQEDQVSTGCAHQWTHSALFLLTGSGTIPVPCYCPQPIPRD